MTQFHIFSKDSQDRYFKTGALIAPFRTPIELLTLFILMHVLKDVLYILIGKQDAPEQGFSKSKLPIMPLVIFMTFIFFILFLFFTVTTMTDISLEIILLQTWEIAKVFCALILQFSWE